MEAIEFDITDQLDTFNKLSKDMPYLISRSLNDVAFKDMRKSFSKDMQKTLKVKNKQFSSDKAFKIDKSSKTNLSIIVYHKKEELGLQQFGGVEKPDNKKLAIPLRTNMARFGGFSRTKALTKKSPMSVGKLLQKSESSAKVKGKTVYATKKGIYLRDKEKLRKIYTFVDKAVHKKSTLDFQSVAADTMNRKFERQLNVHYMRLLRG